jgi:tetratricopeptide (TPR) repeat protein
MNDSNGLNVLETISVVGSIVGTVASVATQQVAFAAIPLSLTATLSFASHKMNGASADNQAAIATLEAQGQQWQLTLDELVQNGRKQQASLDELVQNNQQQQSMLDELKQQDPQEPIDLPSLTEQSQAQQASIDALSEALAEVKQHYAQLAERIDSVQETSQQLADKEETVEGTLQLLQEIDRLNQAIRANPRVADLYYRRGILRQDLNREQDQLSAQEDFTQALQLDSTHADAYLRRGLIASEQGNKRPAAEDFRAAAKYFFELGDLENYEKAKAMGQELHELMSESPEVKAEDEEIAVEGLFG